MFPFQQYPEFLSDFPRLFSVPSVTYGALMPQHFQFAFGNKTTVIIDCFEALNDRFLSFCDNPNRDQGVIYS